MSCFFKSSKSSLSCFTCSTVTGLLTCSSAIKPTSMFCSFVCSTFSRSFQLRTNSSCTAVSFSDCCRA
uniref:Putative secreted protein n=1 Tax=Anopheles darlingi TaxID=43151 RepID=A0A2M4DPY1_ANODA